MPRREDERQANLSGKHPVYCTCTHCTEKFLQKKGIKPGKGLKEKLLGRAGRKKVKAHTAECRCATCNLLRSVDGGPAGNNARGFTDGPMSSGFDESAGGQEPGYHRKKGLLRRLLGKK